MAKPENIIGKGFDKNPQNINRKGPPRKLVSHVNIDLEAMGVRAATKIDIQDMYLRLLNLTTPELQILVNDNKQPAIIRIVGKAILGGKGFEIIEKMLDRTIEKPSQKTDSTINIQTAVDPFKQMRENAEIND